jgi:DNA-binding FadR family transcriptional regulator
MGKTNLHAMIERAIGERILVGEFKPGALLPNEAEWGKIHKASRTVVREAIKSLTAKGLIQSRPKIGSRVEPRSRWNMLDRNVLDWHRAAMDRKAFMLSTQEVRRLIEPGVAELASRKRSPEQLQRLEKAYEAMAAAKTRPQMVAADVEFHEALLACANNELLIPFGIIIEQALSNLFDYTTSRNPQYAKALSMHQRIVRKVALADPAGARNAMKALLRDTDGIIKTTTQRRDRAG